MLFVFITAVLAGILSVESIPNSRCEIKDLIHSSLISREETPIYVNSGQDLHVTCKKGYSPRLVTPHCLNGKWLRNSRSPCSEDDCLVPKVEHGSIYEKVKGDWYYDFWKAMYVQEVIDQAVPFGTLSSPGTIYYLHCQSGYSFQGSSVTERRITCTEGNWQPEPACIPRGTFWTSIKSEVPIFLNKKTTSVVQETTPVSVTTQSQKPSEYDVTQTEVVTTEIITTAKPVQCSCQYPVNDENLVATVDGRQLDFRNEVKDGSVVVLRCLHIGFHRFRGPSEMKCENCQNWHPSKFPTCSKPSFGDTIIVFQHDNKISDYGSLEVKKGQNLTLWCIAYEVGTYPNWTVPTTNGVIFSSETKVRKDREDVLYMFVLKIENADLENGGAYYCSMGDNAETTSTVTVTVIDPNMRCPEFQEDDEVDVFYNNERRVKSTATFSCKYQTKELNGKAVIICLTNGNWSDPSPQCLQRKCKMLKETEPLKIIYTKGSEIGSIAIFHCVTGTNRAGVSFAECMENGSWSHPAPVCDYPPCALEDLYSSLPQKAEPERHNVQNSILPYNANVILTCKDGLIALGDPVAKCEKNGMWKIHSFHCGSGCPAVETAPGSNLKVEPKKNVYNFGEMVQFSCPSGMKLTTDLQQIICLRNGWSDTTLPHCAEKKNLPDVVTTCSRPPEIEEAMTPDLDDTEHAVGTVIKYQCNFGYVSRNSGGFLSVCKINEKTKKAEWTKPEISCSHNVTICGSPPKIEEAMTPDLDDTEHAVGTVIKYQCNLGYVSQNSGGFPSVCKINENTKKAEWTKPEISCSPPEGGTNIKVYPERYSIRQGKGVVFRCRDEGMRRSPVKWIRADNRAMPPGSTDRGGRLSMPNIQPEHSGVYICTSATASPSSTSSVQKTAFLIVQPYVTCPWFIGNNSLVVEYTNNNRVNSSVTFRCNRHEKLIGENSAICMPNGQWSNSRPTCKNHVSCNKFENSENLNVVYSNDAKLESIATFSCVSPYTLVGNHATRCLQNGTWNSTLPSCKASMCSTESLLLSLPEKVLPDLRNITDNYVPYGTELQFLCGPNSFLSGSQKAKCGRQGIWEYGAVRCIQVCVLGEITPQLLVEPSKEFFSFGEMVTFSCPFGQKLSSDVRRVMCLGTSWSDPIPGCVEAVYG